MGLICLSREKSHHGTVNGKLILIALTGVLLDAIGVVLTKKAFTLQPTLGTFSANAIRIAAALIILLVINVRKKVPLSLGEFNKKEMVIIFLSAFLGTFLSLYFYVYAISTGQPPP